MSTKPSDKFPTHFAVGKYAGQLVEDIAKKNPQYVRWAIRSGMLRATTKKAGDVIAKSIDEIADHEDHLASIYGTDDLPHEESRIVTDDIVTGGTAWLDGGWPIGYLFPAQGNYRKANNKRKSR